MVVYRCMFREYDGLRDDIGLIGDFIEDYRVPLWKSSPGLPLQPLLLRSGSVGAEEKKCRLEFRFQGPCML